jgi:hypothetical protein|tara:strand:- start:272 stop:382 length:111 start_codon:yes stop_codon:yes gene_type:complete
LKAEINWRRLFEGLIEDFNTAALDRHQAANFKVAGL